MASRSSQRSWVWTWAALATLLAAGALLYSPATGYPFLRWDDDVYVVERSALQQLAAGEHRTAIARLLSPRDAWNGQFWEYYPLRDLSYAFDTWRGNLMPAPFHQTNVALHLLNVLLLYAIARGLRLPTLPALVAGALFVLHPLAVEPVAWVSGRKDLLYTAFALLALLLLVRSRDRRGASWAAYAAALFAACVAAMASKGPGVIVPFLAAWAVLVDWPAHERKRYLWPLVPAALLATGWAYLAWQIGQRTAVVHDLGAGWLPNLWRALGAPAHAASRIVAPLDLSPSYRLWPESAWLDPFSWIGLLMVAALLLARRKLARIPRPWLLLGGCFLLALLPTAGLLRVSQLRADRFLYLPLAIAALAIAQLAAGAAARRPRATAGLLALFLALFAWQSHRYLQVWRNDIPLWKHVLAQDPDHAFANGGLGAIAMEQAHLPLAKRLLDRALQANPQHATTWSNLGRWWRYRAGDGPLAPGSDSARATQLAEAERAFRHAVALDPRHAAALGQLGLVTWWRGDPEAAERLLRRALALPRCPAEAATTLAALLASQQRHDAAAEATAHYCHRFPAATVCSTTAGPAPTQR